eukprot:4244061-Ditylum_brightwellii.AAC.1
MQKGNHMLKWCTNDCHTEYQKKREEEGKQGAENEQKKRENFKVALSMLLSDKDFKSIEKQFLNWMARKARATHLLSLAALHTGTSTLSS